MIKWIAALVLALYVQGAAAASTAEVAWEAACKHSQYSCEGVEMPGVVVHEGITTHRGSVGAYIPGGDVIFIAAHLSGIDLKRILVHEMVHYLQWVSYPEHMFAPLLCAFEEEAWEVTDKVSPKAKRQGKNWILLYPQCYRWGVESGRLVLNDGDTSSR